MGSIRRATIFNANQLRHTTTGLAVPVRGDKDALEEQVFEGRYAVMGAHLPTADTPVHACRFRIKSQDSWAHHTGLSAELDPTNGEARFAYKEPDPLSVPLVGLGTLTLEASATVSPPRIAGAYIDTRTWLKVETTDGIKIHEAWRRFAIATSVLLTLLYDVDCPPTAFEIKDPGQGRWCRVSMPDLAPDDLDPRSSRLPEAPLLDRKDLGLDRLAVWFDLAERLVPLPHLVAGAVSGTERTVQNRLLELATTAEGLHRMLHTDARRLTKAQVRDARSALAASGMDEDTRKVLDGALRLYLWEPSYPQRLTELAREATRAAPRVTGVTTKWRNAVRDARVGFAHSLGTGTLSGDVIFAYFTLERSLRWLLTARLLMELGMPASDLAKKFEAYERYGRFLRNARRDLPEIYG